MAKQRIKSKPSSKGKHLKAPSTSNTSTLKQKPIFSLEHLQFNSGFCLSNCDKDKKASFADALLKRSKMTWGEIMSADKHGLGQEKISQDAITAPLPSDLKPDGKLIALRFSGKAPMVGRKDGRIFYIYWLDHNCTLYNHG